MSKYWGKQIFSLGSFPEVGQKQKTEASYALPTSPRVAHAKPPWPKTYSSTVLNRPPSTKRQEGTFCSANWPTIASIKSN